MFRKALFLLVPFLGMSACRSTNSQIKTFEVAGDAAAANRLIVDTVVKTYPDVGDQRETIAVFADFLQNAKEGGPDSPEELLKAYYAKVKGSNGAETEFDRYVAQQFLAQTNYLTIQAVPGTKLQFIGNSNH